LAYIGIARYVFIAADKMCGFANDVGNLGKQLWGDYNIKAICLPIVF
jgi:hypothetical protein